MIPRHRIRSAPRLILHIGFDADQPDSVSRPQIALKKREMLWHFIDGPQVWQVSTLDANPTCLLTHNDCDYQVEIA